MFRCRFLFGILFYLRRLVKCFIFVYMYVLELVLHISARALKACGGTEGMAGFPQAPDPVWTSWVRENDDSHVNAAGHAEPRPG